MILLLILNIGIYVCIVISSTIVLIGGHVHTINYELEKDASVVMLGGS